MGEVAGVMYKRGELCKKDIIAESFDPSGGFVQWLEDGDKLVSVSGVIEMIEYISDYHKKRSDSEGSKPGEPYPDWVNIFLSEHTILTSGHTTNTLLCMYGEALMYINNEEALDFLGEVLGDLYKTDTVSAFNEMISLDYISDSKFAKWIDHNRFERRSIPDISVIPGPITRNVCTYYRTFAEKCVEDGISYQMVRDRFLLDMYERDANIEEVQGILNCRPFGVVSVTAERYVDEFGWTARHVRGYFDELDVIMGNPRRSSRIAKRKRGC
jgi:hypothetical protein